jgi:hypothetical protein
MPKQNLWPTSSPEYPADPKGGFTDYPAEFGIQSEQSDFLIGPPLDSGGTCFYPNAPAPADYLG